MWLEGYMRSASEVGSGPCLTAGEWWAAWVPASWPSCLLLGSPLSWKSGLVFPEVRIVSRAAFSRWPCHPTSYLANFYPHPSLTPDRLRTSLTTAIAEDAEKRTVLLHPAAPSVLMVYQASFPLWKFFFWL